MKIRLPAAALLASVVGLAPLAPVQAATTINAASHYAYAANLGWADARGDIANGAVIGEYVCSGYLYAANVGWINLGSGAPTNGIRYQNLAAGDFGVNQDGLGNLRGYAWGANIGWLNFENTGAPRVDLVTGKLSGQAWSANCGWVSLSNTVAHVRTDRIAASADADGDGMADAWERTYTNSLTAFTTATDTDHDGQTDQQEYVAGTNPLDPNDHLRITFLLRGSNGTPNRTDLVWTSQPTRFYRVQQRAALDLGSPWADLTLGFEDWLGWNNVGFLDPGAQSLYRIRAFRPLMP